MDNGFWNRLIKKFSWSDSYQELPPPSWTDWAQRLPRSAFVIWLAGHVAHELSVHKVPVQEMIDAVDDDSTGMLQHNAERFIENFYFGYPSHDPNMYRLIRIFRRIIKRKLKRLHQ